MKWPLFENKIKEELSTHRADVDIDSLWQAIEPAVDDINKNRRKKRRMIFWLWFVGVCLAGGLATTYFLTSANGAATGETIALTKIDHTRNEDVQNAETTLLNENIEIDEQETVISTENQNDVSPKTRSSESPIENKTIENKLKTPITTNSTIVPSDKKTSTENRIKHQVSSIKNTETNSSSAVQETIVENRSQHENTAAIGAASDRKNSLLLTSLPALKMALLKSAEKNIIKLPEPIDFSETLMEDMAEKEAAEAMRQYGSKSPWRFAVGLNGGIGYANRSLSGDDALVELRDQYERSLETTHIGIHFTGQHESGFNASTGLQYTQMVELFERNQTFETRDSVFGIVKYVVISPDTFAVEGMIPNDSTTVYRKKYYNRYKLIDIPVLVGYQHELGDWTIGGQIGVIANISLKTEGRVLSSATTDEAINDLFQSSVGLSYYASASVGYQLNDHLEINAAPYFRFFPKNFAKSSYSVEQKYNLIGLEMRLRYWF